MRTAKYSKYANKRSEETEGNQGNEAGLRDTDSSELSEEFFLLCHSVSKRVRSVSGPSARRGDFFYRRPAWTSVDRAWTAVNYVPPNGRGRQRHYTTRHLPTNRRVTCLRFQRTAEA
jgi:hypothetical protein